MAKELFNTKISKIIADNLKDRNIYFVFASDIIKKTWLEWVIRYPQESGTKAVCADRFIAWDNFKTSFVNSRQKGKVNIPPVIRKIFIQNLIEENKTKNVFDYIISSDEKYKKNSLAFTNWMAKLLPSLKLWHNQYQEYFLKTEGIKDDSENMDYEKLFELYCRFLEQYDFYEPSYLDSDFNPQEKNFIIIYPELFEDYAEYKKIFDETDSITLVHCTIKNKQQCIVYPDARKELRRLCLKIRQLQKQGIDLRTIAVNVPDLETMRPYVEREFNRYSIPYSIRSGVPYLQNCGGDIFVKIQDVINSKFSYNSVRALLLDGYIPWKNPELNNKLIVRGQELRCICCYEENGKTVDVWMQSLKENSEEKNLYIELKKAVSKFEEAKTFAQLMNAWKNFRDTFIDEAMFLSATETDSKEIIQKKEVFDLTNKILGQMITQLKEMQSVEEKFIAPCNLKVQNVLDFYITEMDTKVYNTNSKTYGVNIFKYRVASSANFDYQFIINATQSDISVPFRKLSFITDDAKRKAFGLKDGATEFASTDASEYFVAAYGESNRKTRQTEFYVSCSRQNFNGAAITHTCLEELDTSKKDPFTELDQLDFIKENFLNKEYSLKQKNAFENWSSINGKYKDESAPSEKFNDIMLKKFHAEENKKPKLNATALNSFFQCPRKSAFYALNLTEDSLEIFLTASNELGVFYHKIIELFLKEFMLHHGKKVPAYNEAENKWKYFESSNNMIGGTTDHTAREIYEIISNKFDMALTPDPEQDEGEKDERPRFVFSHLALNSIIAQKNLFIADIYKFMTKFCSNVGMFAGKIIAGLEEYRKTEKDSYIQNGYLDCHLYDPETETSIIVDFKSGSMPKNPQSRSNENDNGKIANFQMAIYVNLVENGKTEKDSTPVSYAIFHKVNGKFDTEEIIKDTSTKSRETFDATLIALNEYNEVMAEKITAKDFEPITSGNIRYIFDKFAQCNKCNFKTICRTTFSLANKEVKSISKS